jgi:hypothetical protein
VGRCSRVRLWFRLPCGLAGNVFEHPAN